MLATVERFNEPWEAHLFRMRLEAEDIPAFVIHEYHIWNAWYLAMALGGARVQVPAERYREAREIWRLCREGQYRQLLQEELGDLDDVCCIYCNSDKITRRPPILMITFAIVGLFFGMIFPGKSTVYRCHNCGRSWSMPFGIPVYEASITILATMTVAFVIVALVFPSILSWPPNRNMRDTYPFSEVSGYPRQ